MSTRANMRSVRNTLEDHLSHDAKILAGTSAILGFAAAAMAGEPLSLAAGLALICKTAGSAIEAGVATCKRFFQQTEALSEDVLPKYDRFRVLFYMTSLRCYIEAIPQAIEVLTPAKEETADTKKPSKDSLNQLRLEWRAKQQVLTRQN